MKIEGPLAIDITDDESSGSRKVEVRFREDFRKLSPEQQAADMKSYIQQLYRLAQSLDQESADYQGVQLILTLCEQVLPYLADQSIDLDETITLEIDSGPGSSPNILDFSNLKLN
jgi:hypothetical protein